MESTRNTSQSGLGQPQATQHSLPLLPRRVGLLRTFSHTSHQTHLGWLVSFAGGCSVILADEDADAGAVDHGEAPRANEGSEAWREGHPQGQSSEAPRDGEAPRDDKGFETRRENGSRSQGSGCSNGKTGGGRLRDRGRQRRVVRPPLDKREVEEDEIAQ